MQSDVMVFLPYVIADDPATAFSTGLDLDFVLFENSGRVGWTTSMILDLLVGPWPVAAES